LFGVDNSEHEEEVLDENYLGPYSEFLLLLQDEGLDELDFI